VFGDDGRVSAQRRAQVNQRNAGVPRDPNCLLFVVAESPDVAMRQTELECLLQHTASFPAEALGDSGRLHLPVVAP